MKDRFRCLLELMVAYRLSALASVLLTIAVSVVDRRFTLGRWDGQDWEFKWSGGSLYWDTPVVRPKFVISQNMGLFFTGYKPKFGDIVLDIGAGVGTEIGEFSALVGPSGLVVAVEADPSAVRRLRKLVGALKYQNVKILELAVSDADGELYLHIAEMGGVENSTASMVGQTSVAVPAKRLDGVLADLGIDSVSYLKMNIEGAEFDALVGLGTKIRSVNEMCISCHDFTGDPSQQTFERVRSYLTENGFQIMSLPPTPNTPWRDFYVFAKRC